MAALANEYTHLERNDHDQDLLIFLKNKLFQKEGKKKSLLLTVSSWGRELGFFMLISMLLLSCFKEMAAHSGILAWRIPWTEEPGGLQSMGSQSIRHD